MTIAIEISAADDFYYHCFNNIAIKHPESHFIFLTTNKKIIGLKSTNNIEYRYIEKKWLLLPGKFFFINRGIHSILKKTKATIYFSSTPSSYIIKRLKTVLYLDRNFQIKKSKNFKLLFDAFSLIVENDEMKKLLTQSNSTIIEKTNTIPYGTSAISPIGQSKKEEIKNKICNGNDFFLMDGREVEHQEIIDALKSFSHFKKWQQSGYKLMLLLADNQLSSITKLITNYKYKEDVVLVSDKMYAESEKELISCAYSVIFINSKKIKSEQILLCFGLRIPVIVSDDDYLRSSFSENILYYNGNELAEKMILLYKNEDLRTALIKKAAEYSEMVWWDKIAEKIWTEIIEKSQT